MGCVVLDDAKELLPFGVIGELYVFGAGLSLGYLNRKKLTEERFVMLDLDGSGLKRYYKSGDLARIYRNGELSYFGRKDDQVKIRGYRIELGEIESALNGLIQVKQALVLAKEDNTGANQLIAYVTSENEIDIQILQKELAMQLPDYMIPKVIIQVANFELTSNGKINRKVLPDPVVAHMKTEEYVAPTKASEVLLAEIWKDLLGIDSVGIYDNFFELGGDSIKAIQLVSRGKESNLYFKVKDVFKHQTIEGINSSLNEQDKMESETGVLEGNLPLHPVQLDFFAKNLKSPNYYNQSMLFSIPKSIKKERLTMAVSELLKHHDALRLSFDSSDDQGITQSYSTTYTEVIERRVKDLDTIPALCDEIQKELNIKTGEVVKFVWIRTTKDEPENRLFIVAHHLSIDGVSWRILVEDLMDLLNKDTLKLKNTLPAKTSSYRQWTEKLIGHAEGGFLWSEFGYWKKILSKAKQLPQDMDYDGEATYKDTENFNLSLDYRSTSNLVHGIHTAYGTEINDILLSALALTIQNWIKGH